ncbi:mechanosensitive ion channel family protein [Parahaliea aestuarii]|uniref:Small-conductance mechanosensitive channel n=1 Tax=Parahaliea aestuarii TaxID=1852021 RepID=A0A5C8ZQ99_9GAMM|nr:mechanosensitive ion channel domain-containing protein [Parahaliea aestuarii]TXS90618.1 mechanosensitive ion channel [Parahaliea aestuarii]
MEMQDVSLILQKVGEYGNLVLQGLLIMIGGMIAIFLLYRLVASFVKPAGTWARLLKVAFGTFYALILVITVLVAANRLGYDASGIAGLAILAVLVVATIVFFLIPFLPRLPFFPGDTIEVRGVMGTVEAITAYQTVIRTFDGQTVFIPSALVMTSAVTNFSCNPARRVAMTFPLSPDSDVESASAALVALMEADEKVLNQPAPAALVTGMDRNEISLFATCWVATPEWFSSRDRLYRASLTALKAVPEVSLATGRLRVDRGDD